MLSRQNISIALQVEALLKSTVTQESNWITDDWNCVWYCKQWHCVHTELHFISPAITFAVKAVKNFGKSFLTQKKCSKQTLLTRALIEVFYTG